MQLLERSNNLEITVSKSSFCDVTNLYSAEAVVDTSHQDAY